MSEHKQREERLISLETRVGRLELVSDKNAETFSTSLQFAELCIQALQRGLDDSLIGAMKTVEIDGVKKVDFKAYLQDALDYLRETTQKVELGTAQESPIVRPGDSVAFEFGG